MAGTVTAPSPSRMLRSPDSAPPLLATGPKPVPPPLSLSSAGDHALRTSQANAVAKRKQSKSRNGCVTCKAKRLKCDETKPTCQHCARRAVTCGGYRKVFQWRPFEEPNAPAKRGPKSRKGAIAPACPVNHTLIDIVSAAQSLASEPLTQPPPHAAHEQQHAFAVAVPINYHAPPYAPQYTSQQVSQLQTPFLQTSLAPIHTFAAPQASPLLATPQSASSIWPSQSFLEAECIGPCQDSVPNAPSGQSPRLIDILTPGTDLSVPPPEYNPFWERHRDIYEPTGSTPPAPVEDDVEQVVQYTSDCHSAMSRRPPSPASSSSSDSPESPRLQLHPHPDFPATSTEVLTRRYNRDTCGVLSVKDGPTENPWRTLVWPLAKDCPALYHAIASMTSFHQSKETPAMRIQGIDHMRNAVRKLAAGLQNMRFDAAISTTLVLAFSESWDQHISTGINHIKGARLLINQALVQHQHMPKQGEEWTRLKFLCNTWIYMDVISRLTSSDEDETSDFDAVHESIYSANETEKSLDPLMGCASTLFPIIGRVANLVRRVRKANTNGPSIISKAMQLRSQLEGWTPPSFVEDPEDETTSPRDSIKTAIAYQYATLLYLHQAVPEIPSLPSSILAKRVLHELDTVEPGSRSTIIHIYPLTAAGCEVTEQKDRDWVLSRWDSLLSRMKLGILDKCLEVTKEVWSRRDAYADEQRLLHDPSNRFFVDSTPLKRTYNSFSADFQTDGDFCWLTNGHERRVLETMTPFSVLSSNNTAREPSASTTRHFSSEDSESLEHDFTVKGRLHWLGVMRDWNWEVLLG